MYLHVDGARIANAAASLGASLRELVTDAGVDAISFGGTKDGMLFGEAAVFLGGVDDSTALFGRKQLTQLASKMRFVSAQFEALLGDGDLWLENAAHANAMATRLAEGAGAIDGVEIVHPVEANAVFARLDTGAIGRLLEALPGAHPFYVWDEAESVVRWVCSWDTTEDDVDAFVASAADAV
jgi:threonine aldolase